MKRKQASAVLLGAIGAAGIALASPFTWTGSGTDDNFHNPNDWLCLGTCPCPSGGCYPDGQDDDAGFRTGGPHDVDLAAVCIDDIDIGVDVNFDAATATTLTVDTVAIAAGAGGGLVTFTANATVTTPACP
ncbi:MAG: hypothetical protein ACE5E6_10145 [Phycisphaerae bacterium]